jgi:hypothetical protein
VSIALSTACAFLAALCYGVASVMQAVAASRAEQRQGLDAMLLVRLATQLPYLAGLGLDALGFVASVIALRNLPLFMVQSMIAGSVGVTAVVASVSFGISLRRYEIVALFALMAGFAMLAVSAKPEHATSLATAGRWILVAGIGVVALAGVLGARLDHRRAAIALAICAGLAWAGTGIAARALVFPSPWWHVVVDPVAFALAAYGILGTLLFATALQRGSVTAVSALVFSTETVLPSIVGLAFLGDQTRTNFEAVAALGVLVTVSAAIALAQRSEPLRDDAGRSTVGS